MDLGIKGKVALVTAGSRGFGRAVAISLAGEGATVAVCARGEDALGAVVPEIKAAGNGRVLPGVVDVTDGDAIAGFVQEIEHELGPIDLMLLNAGGPPAGDFPELDLQQWEDAYRLNLESSVRLCGLVLPGMKQRGFGRIVQITSVTVKQPVENLILSNVIRPATHALIKNLSVQAAPHGVTMNTVAPGFHLTSAVERLITKKIETGAAATREDVLAGWQADIPAGRLGDADEFAALCVFLMSQQAAYITGQCIAADGGWIKGTFA
jgi:3-oxoacyl-[acyl-carrier protein] reductase